LELLWEEVFAKFDVEAFWCLALVDNQVIVSVYLVVEAYSQMVAEELTIS
jgi:hypothetical protein